MLLYSMSMVSRPKIARAPSNKINHNEPPKLRLNAIYSILDRLHRMLNAKDTSRRAYCQTFPQAQHT